MVSGATLKTLLQWHVIHELSQFARADRVLSVLLHFADVLPSDGSGAVVDLADGAILREKQDEQMVWR
jgi:hypothetical protein